MKMNVKEQLQADLKTALLNKDELRKNVIRFTVSAIKNAEIAKPGHELSDADLLALLTTEVKRRKDTISELEKVDRPELLKEEKAQLEVLMNYMPKQLSRAAIVETAQKVIAEVGASGPQATGQVMKRLMADLKGKADGKLVSEVVNELMK
ncbi:MAG TPA: GatB/YqeY domain-containing protein [Anaerolineae bacterium]|nr:GatB/YqeY domain-containing protein [Anaerolineae bacterium]